ncbi:His-Xaa-Ser system-associated MauG-like protein [Salinicola lusitanus]|uniref:His-Xaa-Ser system-associated MauG-like protein n=1 Tax=Salinicola lusitanus TaxID=1949085 RepID=UPI00197E1865|nr:His-Xaa-Ser system-associated MauG-like protein [Salinicola lusitanus]
MKLAIIFLVSLTQMIASLANAERIVYDDPLIRKVFAAYSVERYFPAQPLLNDEIRLGRALFFDPLLSGPKNVACAACHIRSAGSVDGLTFPVGVGGQGVGNKRLESGSAYIIPRNVLPFVNRSSDEFSSYFWDGRVQAGVGATIETPLGENLPDGFRNLLAAAAIFPLIESDEMLGRSRDRVGNSSNNLHHELVDSSVDSDNFQERSVDVFSNIMKRLIGSEESLTPTQAEYRKLFGNAYPYAKSFTIVDVGNALSSYIDFAFRVGRSPFDRYVSGDDNAITVSQKAGAIVFWGKGRCAVCHSNSEFSDFKFHSLAVPQLSVGKNGANLDYGRGKATGEADERFLFRTPPLRNVTKTGPWGHNGSFNKLSDIIIHHFNPVPYLYRAQRNDPSEAQMAGRLLRYRSPILAEIFPISEADVENLVSFMSALDSDFLASDEEAIPKRVPSGMNQFIKHE